MNEFYLSANAPYIEYYLSILAYLVVSITLPVITLTLLGKKQ
jgi:hypothetical protein